jgi:DNA-directed RNA polymerase specialized sigma24 family protein
LSGWPDSHNTTSYWLLSEDDVHEGDQVDRLAGDSELEKTLRIKGFQGPEYDYFQEVLAAYGLAVIRGWTRSGLISGKCRDKGVAVSDVPGQLRRDLDEVDSLAGETVARALTAFRDKVLLCGKWDPAKGASLRTYFVGQCLFQFPNQLRNWIKIHEQDTRQDSLDLDYHDRSKDDAEKEAMMHILFDDALGSIKRSDAKKALAMKAWGFKDGEIAKRLGTTVKAVERMVSYARQTARGRVA